MALTKQLPNSDKLDLDRLRERYRVERERRLRKDGNSQYVETDGKFSRYLDDPHADPSRNRTAVTGDHDVIVVGGGFGGMLTAARLQQAGIVDFRIIERGSDFGGTWYWNRYPGAACDTESYIYMPLLEEVGYIPSAKYAKAPELLEHCQRIGRHFDLYPRSLFQTTVKTITWDEAVKRWVIATDGGDCFTARYVVMAGGTALGLPKLPGVPGIETFRGHTFHTSRWDYEYTGGDSTGNLYRLHDKRVGIIGTGATAVQCIPHLGEWARELFVFQRTPSAVDIRADRPTDASWAASLASGWQKARMENFSAVISGADFDEDMVNDGWTDVIGNILLAAKRKAQTGEPVEDPEALVELADFQKMESVRARIDAIVRDPKTAEALKPWYNLFCKRPCFHDDYLPTFNRPNVHLVDTRGKGVERITEKGVVVDSVEYKVDCLIYATGFEVGTDYLRSTGFEVYGRGGLDLTSYWKDGAQTLHSMMSRNFPNAFVLSALQSGQSANFQHMLDEKARHIAFIIQTGINSDVETIEPTQDAQDAWTRTIVTMARARQPFLAACTPGYYNNEGGDFTLRSARNNQYWRGPMAFVRLLEKWREDGSLPGMEVTRRAL